MNIRINLAVFVSFALILLYGCGLIYPTDIPETPEPQIANDPFSFSQILDSTRERFSRSNYEELFHEQFKYIDNDNRIFSRNELIERLRLLESECENSDNILSVSWHRTEGRTDPNVISRNDTITLYRDYLVSEHKKDNPAEKSKFDGSSGSSEFRLVFHIFKNSWSILSWRNIPRSGKDLFHPQYNN